ncbi:MAG: glutamate dehydrogenase, partial [Gammaproteobacteria bacterium]
YKRIMNQFTGVLTGKGLSFGGREIRVEATGYGCVYMMEDMLRHIGDSVEDKIAVISGSGNVAQYAAEKLLTLGAKVVTLSDSSGYIYDEQGLTTDKLAFIKELKNNRRGRIKEYADEYGVPFFENRRPWEVPCDLALPCATQNEIEVDDAKMLVSNGVKAVSEGANMPSTVIAMECFQEAGVLFAPSKAANAGGVAVSGLEMTQNSMRLAWDRDELNHRLRQIMNNIHDQCVEYGASERGVDYVKGANVAGFIKVADAIIAYGVM